MSVQSRKISLRNVRKTLAAAKLPGFGGNCGAAAIAINEILFQGKGELIGAFNEAFFKKDRPRGHIAVFYQGKYWDTDGKPKPWEEIESWGMLDPEDPDYIEEAKSLNIEWNDEIAEGVLQTITPLSWIELYFDCSKLEEFKIALLEI